MNRRLRAPALNRRAWLILSMTISACSAGGGGLDRGSGGEGGTSSGVGGSGFTDPGMDPAFGNDVAMETCSANCQDFPADPIFDTTDGVAPAPPDAATFFGDADNFGSSGACVREPQLSEDATGRPGALFPANWLEPRFRWQPLAGENLFEIRLSTAKETNDLVAYTTATTWIMPKDIWLKLAGNVHLEPIVVTIRGVNTASPGTPSGTRGSFQIAPVNAGGKMVYWATTSSDVAPTTSRLYGFGVGEDNVIEALTIPQVQQDGILHENGHDLRGQYSDAKGVDPGHVQCIGCHTSTPDGAAVAFTDHWPWNDVFASIEKDTVGAVPSYVSAGAQLLLNQPWLGMQTMTSTQWADGDRIVISSYAGRSGGDVGFNTSALTTGQRLAWFLLDTATTFPTGGDVTALNSAIEAAIGSAWGFLELNGETQNAATPDWSNDGSTIVYTSAGGVQDGRLGSGGEYDLATVPYDNRQGGTVQKVAGASEPGIAEYYPSFSANDQLIAFNRLGTTTGAIYYRPEAEINIIPASGGTPIRLDANDPPSCTGEQSPGLINSWAKWSPRVTTVDGKEYYFLIFSSARDYPGTFSIPKNQYSPADTRASQLYMASIVRDTATGDITTYPAIYLWNQTTDTSNLTPAWDDFLIPPAPPRIQ